MPHLQHSVAGRVGDRKAAAVQLNKVVARCRRSAHHKICRRNQPARDHQRIARSLVANNQRAVLPNAAAYNTHTITATVPATDNTRAIDDHLPAIRDHKAVACPIAANGQIVAVAPNRTRAAYQHTVARTDQKTERTDHLAAIVDRQAVTLSFLWADGQCPAITPHRAYARDQYAVAGTAGTSAHVSEPIRHLAPIANDQTVPIASIAHEEIGGVVPSRTSVADQHGITAAAGVKTYVARDACSGGWTTEHATAIDDHQAVAGSRVTHGNGLAITPDRPAIGHQNTVVAAC